MVMVNHSQGSVTGKGFVLQVFEDGAEVARSELSSRNFACVLHKHKAICTSTECEWTLYSGWFSISTSLVAYLRGLHLEPELDPAPFIPHACKTPPNIWYHDERLCLGRWAQLCEWLCITRMLFHEQLGWGMQMKPAPAAPGRNPTLLTIWTDWCASWCGNRVLHFMHSKGKSYIYAFPPILSCLFPTTTPPIPHFSLCVQHLHSLRKKFTEGQRHEQCFCMCYWLLLQLLVWKKSCM